MMTDDLETQRHWSVDTSLGSAVLYHLAMNTNSDDAQRAAQQPKVDERFTREVMMKTQAVMMANTEKERKDRWKAYVVLTKSGKTNITAEMIDKWLMANVYMDDGRMDPYEMPSEKVKELEEKDRLRMANEREAWANAQKEKQDERNLILAKREAEQKRVDKIRADRKKEEEFQRAFSIDHGDEERRRDILAHSGGEQRIKANQIWMNDNREKIQNSWSYQHSVSSWVLRACCLPSCGITFVVLIIGFFLFGLR